MSDFFPDKVSSCALNRRVRNSAWGFIKAEPGSSSPARPGGFVREENDPSGRGRCLALRVPARSDVAGSRLPVEISL